MQITEKYFIYNIASLKTIILRHCRKLNCELNILDAVEKELNSHYCKGYAVEK